MRHFPLLMLIFCLLPARAMADAASIFREAKGEIFQIRILDAGSGTRAAYGSGFAVDDSGDVVTNFHVVSDLVDKPGQFVIEAVDVSGQRQAAELLWFDVINDLALLRVPTPAHSHVTIAADSPEQGARLYSIGLPLDQGFTIAEGTYNGLVPDALTPRIHFTGPVNPGVSGGPAVDDRGELVGVNVSTMGNSVGHLVPGAMVARLLEHRGGKPLDGARSKAILTQELTQHQNDFIDRLMAVPWSGVRLGNYSAPGQIAPWLKCWASSQRIPTRLYDTTTYGCYPENNELFVTERLSSGAITVTHNYVTSRDLGSQRFAWVMSQQSRQSWGDFGGIREDAGNFRCHDDYVRHGKVTLEAQLCVRALRKLPGLYDAAFETVTVAGPGQGLVSQLKIQGASFANILRLSQRFLEQITWTP